MAFANTRMRTSAPGCQAFSRVRPIISDAFCAPCDGRVAAETLRRW